MRQPPDVQTQCFEKSINHPIAETDEQTEQTLAALQRQRQLHQPNKRLKKPLFLFSS